MKKSTCCENEKVSIVKTKNGSEDWFGFLSPNQIGRAMLSLIKAKAKRDRGKSGSGGAAANSSSKSKKGKSAKTTSTSTSSTSTTSATTKTSSSSKEANTFSSMTSQVRNVLEWIVVITLKWTQDHLL